MACSKCKQESTECTCHNNSCDAIDAACVIYKPGGGPSNLACITDIPTKTSVEKILELWDQKHCELDSVAIISCVKDKLNIAPDINTLTNSQLLTSIQNWICNYEDVKVKASPSDSTNGYLASKLDKGDCLLLTTVINSVDNSQKIKISIDWPCLIAKIPTCFTLESNDCLIVDNTPTPCIPQPLTPVISRQGSTLVGTNCNGSLQWYTLNGVLVGSGNNFTAISNETYFAKCITVCGESPATPVLQVPPISTFTKIRTAYFTRNDCGVNLCNVPCSGTSITYTKTYTSNVSQQVVDSMAENDNTFSIEGQLNANTNATCSCSDCNCVFPVYNSNLIINNATCSGNIIQANGQVTITGIGNANKFGWSFGAGDYAGVGYNDALSLVNFNQGNIETTATSIKLKALSVETRIVVRIYNQAITCYRDVVIILTPPDCTQEQVELGDIDVVCSIDNAICKNWSITAGSTGATVWYLDCNTNQYIFNNVNANTTAQRCSTIKPQVSGGVATENGTC